MYESTHEPRAKPIVQLDRGVEQLLVGQVLKYCRSYRDVKDASPSLPPLMPKGGDEYIYTINDDNKSELAKPAAIV